jgi:hypothetical protein
VQIQKIEIFSVEVLSWLYSDLRDPLRVTIVTTFAQNAHKSMEAVSYSTRLQQLCRELNTLQAIYNMYRFVESILLSYEKIVEKLQYYGGGQNFAFYTPANQHMSCTFFLFLIFNLQRLPELRKKELDKKNTLFVQRSTFIL